jgi:hypothetical protein
VRRFASAASRAGFAGGVALLCLALLRLAPFYASCPWNIRALPVGALTLALGIAAVSLAVEQQRRTPRALVVLLLSALGALLAVVFLRGAGGLRGEVQLPEGLPGVAKADGLPGASKAHGGVYRLPSGPIDMIGADLGEVPALRRFHVQWRGELRAPEAGLYRLWADGRGEVRVVLDGRPALLLQGERLRGGADVLLTRGAHELDVVYERVGPGPWLRFGWTTPAGLTEVVSPRQLGARESTTLWRLTDALALVVALLAGLWAWWSPWDRRRRAPTAWSVTRAELTTSLLAHGALFILMTWPLFAAPASVGVVGSPDGRLNAWILAWNAHALLHQPTQLFQAPIFHPLPDALAFSESLLLPGLVGAPLVWAAGPVLAYNFWLLVSSVVSALGAQLLVRRVSGDRLAAFVGGAVFGVGVHRYVRMAHLHAHLTLFLPLALLALDRFWERRSLKRALLVGLLVTLQGLCSVYLGAITAVTVACAAALALAAGLRPREAGRLLAGLALPALLLVPLLQPYLRMRSFEGVEFTLSDVAKFATTPESYAASASVLYRGLTERHLDPVRVRDTLFPGLVPLLLGLSGLAVAPRRYKVVALFVSLVAVLVSLGPETALYRALHEHFILFRGIRALGRFAIVPSLSLAVLSGLSLSGRSRTTVLVALGLLLVESRAAVDFASYLPPSPAARWLAGRTGAVAYLPLGEGDTEAMLQGIAHFRPLVNGDSGFIPRPYDRVRELLEPGLTEDALHFLRAVGVRHVVSRVEEPLPEVARFGEERIYELAAGDRSVGAPEGSAVATLWTDRGTLIDLGARNSVTQVSFELSDAPWIRRPEVRLSLDGMTWTEMHGFASLAEASLSLANDPRSGRGRVRLPPTQARYLWLDSRLPVRRGILWVKD